MKPVNYRQTEEYKYLCEEISSGFIEYAKKEVEETLRFKYIIAETIVNHPVYQKFGKGNSEFIENLVKDVKRQLNGKTIQRISRASVYNMLQLYEKEPDVEKVIDKAGSYTNALSVYLGRERIQVVESSAECNNSCKKHCHV